MARLDDLEEANGRLPESRTRTASASKLTTTFIRMESRPLSWKAIRTLRLSGERTHASYISNCSNASFNRVRCKRLFGV
jgi:hypothetical protein